MAKPAPDWDSVPYTAASAKHCQKVSEQNDVKIKQNKALQKKYPKFLGISKTTAKGTILVSSALLALLLKCSISNSSCSS